MPRLDYIYLMSNFFSGVSLTDSRKLTDTYTCICVNVQKIFYGQSDFFYGIQGHWRKLDILLSSATNTFDRQISNRKTFLIAFVPWSSERDEDLTAKRDYVLRGSPRHCLELHNYAMITRNAGNVNGERAVNTTFVVRAKRNGCPCGWLWWCGLFTNMIYDVLPRRASARLTMRT